MSNKNNPPKTPTPPPTGDAVKDAMAALAADGKAALIAPKGATSCSWGGESYEVEDGFVVVPAEAVTDLFSHGYTTP